MNPGSSEWKLGLGDYGKTRMQEACSSSLFSSQHCRLVATMELDTQPVLPATIRCQFTPNFDRLQKKSSSCGLLILVAPSLYFEEGQCSKVSTRTSSRAQVIFHVNWFVDDLQTSVRLSDLRGGSTSKQGRCLSYLCIGNILRLQLSDHRPLKRSFSKLTTVD